MSRRVKLHNDSKVTGWGKFMFTDKCKLKGCGLKRQVSNNMTLMGKAYNFCSKEHKREFIRLEFGR